MNRIPKPIGLEDLAFLQTLKVDYTEGKVYSAKGKEIGSLNPGHGRINIKLATRNVRRYHIIWWAATGKWPAQEIDHKDRNKINDRYGNLQLSTPQTNGQNCAKRSEASLTLPVGVCRTKSGRKPYGAQMRIEGRTRSLGTFATIQEASEAYQNTWRMHHG